MVRWYVRSRRGSRPLDLLARCDRVPSARVRANCSSSDGRKKKNVGDLVSFFGWDILCASDSRRECESLSWSIHP